MSIFISHSSKDAEIAAQICSFLEEKGKTCFLAPRDISSGREYAEEIVNGIDRSTAMVLIMSERANQSPHVLREVERAVSKNIPILVYKVEEVVLSKSMEYFLMTHQWLAAKPQGSFEDIWRFVCEREDGRLPETEHAAGAKATKENQGNERTAAGNEPERQPIYVRGPWGSGKLPMKKRLLLIGAIVLLMIGAIAADQAFRKNHPADEALDKESTVSSESGQEQDSKQTASSEGDGQEYVCEYELGDTLTFGTYNGAPVEWRVLKLSEDKTQAVLVSKDILTMKAYDAAESGTYNKDGDQNYWFDRETVEADPALQAHVRGNSDWSTSNIRTWLNAETEIVQYADQPPRHSAMSELRNGYDNEPGFLHDFTAAELAAIVTTRLETGGNALAGSKVVTEDKVYLLSRAELEWFVAADVSQLATPTEQALEQDKSGWYEVEQDSYGLDTYVWWLREPVAESGSQCYLVGSGYAEDNIRIANAGLEGYGIRPAMTVDLRSDCFQKR